MLQLATKQIDLETASIPIRDIKIPHGRRPLRDVTALAESINQIGLLNPITLSTDTTLIAGLHRLEACKMLGWEWIDCHVVALAGLQAELAEIDENLRRNELTELEQAQQLKRRKEIYEALYPQTKQGGKGGWHNNKGNKADLENEKFSFSRDTADAIGVTQRSIQYKTKIAQDIDPDVQEAIKDLPVADNQSELLTLAKLPAEKQTEVATALTEGKDFRQAMQSAGLQPKGAPVALQQSDSNEWYTPKKYLDAVHEVMGGVDTDPASNPTANEIVQATTYYTIETNGFNKDWHGRVFLNPPYGRDQGESNQDIWTTRLIGQYKAGITTEAILLVNAVTDRKWFQPLWNYLICFTDHRIKFYNQSGEVGQPTHGNVFVYFGNQPDKFAEVFKQFGAIARRIA